MQQYSMDIMEEIGETERKTPEQKCLFRRSACKEALQRGKWQT